MSRFLRFSAALSFALTLFCLPSHAVNWLAFGPDGGDARSFAVDPHNHSHLYLGSATGWLYESINGGEEWKRLAWVGQRDDLVLDSLVVSSANSKRMVVGAWVLESPDGGLFTSNDGGVSWQTVADMKGQSIRALTAAPSNPNILVAGTLKGVYRSEDGGDHWKLISPEGSQELHEVESIAIDPVDPSIIYAGTWHLPWKTTDGGQHWTNIKEGVIDDSDVFSIIVDPKDSKVVYASACSGIYKSITGGERFQKVQGIPSTARRTRVLMQDPKNQNIVFAGTTEGLYRTTDSGTAWQRMTGPEVIINDVYVDPTDSNRVLLATDRGGVLASNDGGVSFSQSNRGFSARQITSYVADNSSPENIYVGVVNDKALGGVFASQNGGLTWTQKSAGLDGHDVFSLAQASDGSLLAGTRHGFYRLQGEVWSRQDDVTLTRIDTVTTHVPAKRTRVDGKIIVEKAHTTTSQKVVEVKPSGNFEAIVNGMARAGDTLYAATSSGLLQSTTGGKSWHAVEGVDPQSWNFVAAAQSNLAASSFQYAVLSSDGGVSWQPMKLPSAVDQVSALAVDGSGGVWVGGRQGIFISDDKGSTWNTVPNLYLWDVSSIFYDPASQRILVAANNRSSVVFEVHLPERKVRYWNAGWSLRLVRPVGDHLVGATRFDGMVIQPRMVDSSQVAGR